MKYNFFYVGQILINEMRIQFVLTATGKKKKTKRNTTLKNRLVKVFVKKWLYRKSMRETRKLVMKTGKGLFCWIYLKNRFLSFSGR